MLRKDGREHNMWFSFGQYEAVLLVTDSYFR
jgi:hypothetical protein